VAQGYLFLPRAPDPQKLELTLARLKGVVGEGKAGSPELLNTHRPDAFRMNPFGIQLRKPVTARSRKSKVEGRRSNIGATVTFDSHDSTLNSRVSSPEFRSPLLLRLFRPPLATSVEVQAGRPVRVDSHHVRGHVVSVAGPWRTSGAWWTDDSWEHDEWDVAVSVVSGQWLVASGLWSITGVEGRKFKVERIHCYRVYQDLTNGQWYIGGLYD